MDDNNPKTPDTQETPAPEGQTDNAQAALDEEKVNKLVTNRLKRETEKLQKSFDAKLAEITAALTAPPTDKPADDHARKQHEAALAKIAEMEKEREVERAEAAKAEEKAALAGAMSELGVVNQKALVALLKEEGKVTRTPDGSIVFKGQLKDLSLKEGLAEFLSTDEGKFFKAPTGAAGSGAAPAKAIKGDGKLSQEEAWSILFNAWKR